MTEENHQPEIKTKQSFREQVWVHMAKEELTNSFRSLCNRIPYFKGASEATQRLGELDEFKKSKLLMISPDKLSVILLSLQKEKEILIPKPRLFAGLFLHVKNAVGLPEEETKDAVTRNNIKQLESPIGFDSKDLKVDMLVLGSICVNKSGYRIGDGDGFADLEHAILSSMKAVDENTTIVTLVHDCQIIDDLPNDLLEPHDVPVDIIVTPTQTIVVNPRLRKPTEIIWSAISKRRLAAIPVLNQIKLTEEEDGKVLTLKEADSDEESRVKDKIRVKKMITELYPKLRRKKVTSDVKENEKGKEIRRKPFLRKRRLRKPKDNSDDSNNDAENKPIDPNQQQAPLVKPIKAHNHRQRSNAPRNHVDFSLRLSNIASTVRVRDLKSALLERGVKPSNITWRGQRGFCYLHFGKLRKRNSDGALAEEKQPVQVDSIVANLQQLKIGEQEAERDTENGFIVVEPAEPVTRIEVTDVSAV